MAQYKTGTASVTNGSQVVTGTGTLWLSNVSPGDGFTVAGTGVPYTVGSVDSNEQMTLNANYAGPSGSGLAYAIWRDFEANTGAPEMSQGDIETATIFTRAIRALGQRLGLATTSVAGIVEKATTTEAQDAVIGKFPDARGVKDYIKQFGVGEFGQSAAIFDFNAVEKAGIYGVSPSGVSNAPTTNYSAGTLIHSAYDSNQATQLFLARLENGLYFRRRVGGSWQSWVALFHSSNVLGTVSQSGGTPTGAIIERGSNANGEYTKFADGTLLMSATKDLTFSIPVGDDLFLGTGNSVVIFPLTSATEISSVSVSGAPKDTNGDDVLGSFLKSDQSSLDRWNVVIDNYNGNAQIESISNVTLTAHGRWF